MEKVLESTLLYDFYSELLTEKQRQMFSMYYLDDLSLSEIGDEFEVSRQAVHDILYRTERKLTDYEMKLKLVSKHLQIKAAAEEIVHVAQTCISKAAIHPTVSLEDELRQIITLAVHITENG